MPFNATAFLLQQILLDAALVGLPIAYYFFKKKDAWVEFKLKPIPWNQLVRQSATIFAAIFIASFLIIALASVLNANDLQPVGNSINTILQNAPWMIAYLFTFRVISEELFFRSFMVPRVGMLVSTVFFAIAHALYGSMLQVLGAFLLGLILAHYFKKNNSIYPNIVAHALYNMVALVLLV